MAHHAPQPTIETIRAGAHHEGDTLDFKRQLNLDSDDGRIRLVNDVVAFLNRGPAHILIGVVESGGAFADFMPCSENRDLLEQKLLSILQSSIDPVPLDIRIRFVDVDDGYVIDIDIPAHDIGPFQNRITGAFLIRTGAKNTPISREGLRGYFVDRERRLGDFSMFMTAEDARLDASGRMTERGPYLRMGILPHQHYDLTVEHFTQPGNVRRSAPVYGDSSPTWFKGCEGGNEAFTIGGDGKGASRLFVRDDWFIHVHVAWPIWVTAGEERPTVHEFKSDLPDYLAQLDEWFGELNIIGPYAITIELKGLQRTNKIGWLFEGINEVRLPRPRIVRSIADETMSKTFLDLVTRSTRWG